VAVPVAGIVPVTVKVWSTSSFVALTVGAPGAVSAEATVTVTDAAEVFVSGEVALSVAFNSKA